MHCGRHADKDHSLYATATVDTGSHTSRALDRLPIRGATKCAALAAALTEQLVKFGSVASTDAAMFSTARPRDWLPRLIADGVLRKAGAGEARGGSGDGSGRDGGSANDAHFVTEVLRRTQKLVPI